MMNNVKIQRQPQAGSPETIAPCIHHCVWANHMPGSNDLAETQREDECLMREGESGSWEKKGAMEYCTSMGIPCTGGKRGRDRCVCGIRSGLKDGVA